MSYVFFSYGASTMSETIRGFMWFKLTTRVVTQLLPIAGTNIKTGIINIVMTDFFVSVY